MKLPTHEITALTPSLSDVHRKLSELQDEFVDLIKHEVVLKAKDCDRLATSIREHLYRARVLVLSTQVNEVLREMDAIRNLLDRLQSSLHSPGMK